MCKWRRECSEISEGNFEKRCLDTGDDEIGELAKNFNVMADRMVTAVFYSDLMRILMPAK